MSDDAALRSAIAALVTELGSLRRRLELVDNRAGVQQAISGATDRTGASSGIFLKRSINCPTVSDMTRLPRTTCGAGDLGVHGRPRFPHQSA